MLSFGKTLAVALLAVATVVLADDDAPPAKSEPHHHPVFENELVRILDVEVKPGEGTDMHRHSLDYPYLMLTRSLLLNEKPGKEGEPAEIGSGLVGFYRASVTPYTHRFVNIGKTDFRAIGIELLQAAPKESASHPLDDTDNIKKALDNDRARAYRVTIPPGATVGPITFTGAAVSVALAAAVVEQQEADGSWTKVSLEPAMYEFLPAPAKLSWRNSGDKPVSLVTFEIR